MCTNIFLYLCMICEYENISTYLMSKTSVIDKIRAIDNLIDLMIVSMAEYATGSGSTISEYQLDDGQVKIKTGYRSLTEITNGLKNLEHIRQIYINRFNGRCVVLRDLKSFR